MRLYARAQAFLRNLRSIDNTHSETHQLSDTTTSIIAQEQQAKPNLIHYDIDPQGDVIFEVNNEISVRVSSAVLRLCSDYFRSNLFGPWRESLAERSTTNPARLPLQQVDSHTTHRLFCLLHHQADPEANRALSKMDDAELKKEVGPAARRLRDLAVTADYFQSTQALNMTSDSLLQNVAAPDVRDVIPFQATVDLVSAAYILKKPRYFRLFSKRLITDYTENFSNAEFPDGVPDTITSELAQQSTHAWTPLTELTTNLSRSRCSVILEACFNAIDPRLPQKLAASILTSWTAWPKHRSDGIPLRRLLVGLYHLERVELKGWCDIHRGYSTGTLGPEEFLSICGTIDTQSTLGLCSVCVRKSERGSAVCRCSSASEASEVRRVCGDSYTRGNDNADVVAIGRMRLNTLESIGAAFWEAIS